MEKKFTITHPYIDTLTINKLSGISKNMPTVFKISYQNTSNTKT